VAVNDPDRSKEFYTSLFGWTADDQTDPEGNVLYTMFSQAGKHVAGLGAMPPQMTEAGIPPMWSSYVTVYDIDAAVSRAESTGGTVISQIDIHEAGRMAFVVDPTGAVVQLWQPGDHKGAGTFTGHGTMSWNELATRDVAKAQAFYAEVVGWRFEDAPGPFDYQLIMMDTKVDGEPYMFDTFNGGMLAMDENWPDEISAHWMVYFTVDNAGDVVGRVEALGGTVAVAPFDTPNGRIAVIGDPDNAKFSIIAPSQAVAPDEE